MTSKNRVSVNLADNEYQELLAISQEHHISMAWLGRQAIVGLLEQYKQNELQLPLGFVGRTGTANQ